MFNTPFIETDKETVYSMTKLYSQIIAVCFQSGTPVLKTILWMNENFEKIYLNASTDVEVYEKIFNTLGVKFSTIKSNKN